MTGTVAADPTNTTGTIFTFTPSAPLAYNTTYTALITTGVQAASQVPEVPLAADYTWSFTTAPPPPATVSAVTPASGSTGVAITGTTVTATFGAAMTASTINPSTFSLTGPSGAVAGAVVYNATTFTATFTPSASFAYGATYTATIGTGVTSSLGGPLPAPYTWSFTTVKGTVPTVTSVTPASGATNVSAANAVTATFSEPMNAATLTTSTFTLTPRRYGNSHLQHRHANGDVHAFGSLGSQHCLHRDHHHGSAGLHGRRIGLQLRVDLHNRRQSERGGSEFRNHLSDHPRLWRSDCMAWFINLRAGHGPIQPNQRPWPQHPAHAHRSRRVGIGWRRLWVSI